MALLIAIFSVIYAGVFSYYDMHEYWYLIVLNLLFVIVMILVPLAHGINDIAAALVITAAEYAALFVFVWAFGRNSGIQINYIIAAAVAFAVRCKFTPHEELRRLLLSTGDRNLAEAAPNDYYWGIGKKARVRTGSGFCSCAFASSSAGRPSR
jgi:hypothetical protein